MKVLSQQLSNLWSSYSILFSFWNVYHVIPWMLPRYFMIYFIDGHILNFILRVDMEMIYLSWLWEIYLDVPKHNGFIKWIFNYISYVFTPIATHEYSPSLSKISRDEHADKHLAPSLLHFIVPCTLVKCDTFARSFFSGGIIVSERSWSCNLNWCLRLNLYIYAERNSKEIKAIHLATSDSKKLQASRKLKILVPWSAWPPSQLIKKSCEMKSADDSTYVMQLY